MVSISVISMVLLAVAVLLVFAMLSGGGPGDGGDALVRRVGRREREEKRERIVDARIGVDDEVHI